MRMSAQCAHVFMLIYFVRCSMKSLAYFIKIIDTFYKYTKTRQLSRYNDWLRAGRSGIESRWGRDFPPLQTGTGAHPASCKMGTGSFPGVKCGRSVLLTSHPLLVPRSWKSRAIPLPTLWATPGLWRDHFTFLHIKTILPGTFTAFRCVITCVITCSLVETVEHRQGMDFRWKYKSCFKRHHNICRMTSSLGNDSRLGNDKESR